MEVSSNGGTQQPWVFLLKMIIFGVEIGGTTILGPPPYTSNHYIHSELVDSVKTMRTKLSYFGAGVGPVNERNRLGWFPC